MTRQVSEVRRFQIRTEKADERDTYDDMKARLDYNLPEFLKASGVQAVGGASHGTLRGRALREYVYAPAPGRDDPHTRKSLTLTLWVVDAAVPADLAQRIDPVITGQWFAWDDES